MFPSLRTIDTQKIVIVFSKAGLGVCATAISIGESHQPALEVGKTLLSPAQASSLIARLQYAGVNYLFDASFADVAFSATPILHIEGESTDGGDAPTQQDETKYVSPFIDADFILSFQQTRGPNL